MNLVRSRGWGQVKPVAGARADWGHPLAAGLRACFLLNEGGGLPGDIAIGGPAAVTTNAAGVPRVGNGLRFTNGVAQWAQKQLVPLVGAGNVYNSAWTMDCLVHVYGTTRGGFITYGGLDAAGASVGIGGTTFDGTGTNLISLDMGRAWHATTTPVPTDGSAVHVVMTNSPPSTVTVYMNGLLITSWSSSSAGTADSIFQIGNEDHSTGRSPTCTIDTARLWNRTFTIGDVAALRAEPYAFIAPPGPKILYIDLGGVSSTPISDGDTGAGADAGESIAASISDGDTGTATDAGESITAAIADADTATATDAGESIAATATDAETGTAMDAGESIAATLADGDTATALDDMTITVLLADSDAATAVDTELLAVAITDADTAVVAEAEAIVAAILDTELATAADLLVVDTGIRRDIDYRVADAPIAWRSGDVDTAWEAADVPTVWKAGDA